MPNPIKYTTDSGSLALKKGNFLFGTGDVGKGPSETTGFYNGVNVPKPGYVVYQFLDDVPGNLTYASFTGDTEFINFTNGVADQTFTSVKECFVYYRSQNDKICFNRDYEPIVTDGLVLNLDAGFDGSYPESGTTWSDLSLSGNSGTLINGAGYYANGGGGIVFDGVDDNVSLGNNQSLQFTDNFSAFVWVKPSSQQFQKGIIGNASFNNGGWMIALANNFFKPIIVVNSQTEQAVIGNITLLLNNWYHIGFTFSSGVLTLYVNGVVDASGSGLSITKNTTNFLVGAGSQGGWGSFNGNISSSQVYNRALTSSEVLQNYNAMKDRFAFIFTVDTTKTGVSTSTQFKLPLVSSGTINFVVEWGDGTSDTITTFNQAQTTHTYSSGGVYEIKIRGILRGWQFAGGGDRLKMGEIKNWGCLNISVNNGFNGCTNMTCVATDAPVISSTSLLQYFNFCSNFNGPVGNWDVSLVVNMVRMFEGAQKFNKNLGDWNVGNVTNMSIMFQGNGMSFNNGGSDSIKNWNVSKVTNFEAMFWRCPFNQPIGSWDVSSATNMSQMFVQNIFNQDIGAWDVSNVTNMSSMFRFNTVFNNGGSESINNWRPNKCTNFSYMFSRARFDKPIGDWTFAESGINMEGMFYSDSGKGIFNQDIGFWNVSGVTNMSLMFNNSVFNQNIGSWNTSNVTNMSQMFLSNSNFNQNIGSWNVSKVTNFSNMFRSAGSFNNGGSPSISGWTMSAATTFNSMFRGASSFNQPIGSWDTRNLTDIGLVIESANSFNQNIGTWDMSKVTNVSRSLRSQSFNNGGSPDINNWNLSGVTSLFGMFWDASNFNQPIKDWNITGVTTAGNFFTSGSQYSTANYDDILNTWSQKNVKSGVTINFASIKYSSAGADGRATLVNTYGWTITDGGQV